MSTLRARGIGPSLGAGGSLIVAGLCCLIFVSAMLAFRDWPGASDARPDGSLALRAPERKAAGRVATGPVAATAAEPAPATGTAAPATDAPRRAASRRNAALTPGRPSTPAAPRVPATGTPPSASAPAAVTTPQTAAAPTPAQPPTAPSGSGSGGNPSPQQPAGPAERIVTTGRSVVEQVPLPAPAQQPVDQVLDTTQGAARTIDEIAGPLLPQLP